MKRDPSTERLAAFVKRLMICATQCAANITAGLIFLLAEVCRQRPEILQMLKVLEKEEGKSVDTTNDIHMVGNFNMEKREPLFAVSGDGLSNLWEIVLLRQHFHPSVKAFSESWLKPPDHKIVFDGDPIADLSMSAFLNRFSYKNPKTRNIEKVHRPLPKAEDPVNSELFIGEDAESISPDKAFFHKYFGSRMRLLGEGKLKDRSRRKVDEEHSEEESGDDMDEDGTMQNAGDEEEIDKYADTLAEQLMKSAAGNEFNRPDIDDDLDFSEDDDSSGSESMHDCDSGSENNGAYNDLSEDSMDGLSDSEDDEMPSEFFVEDEEDFDAENATRKTKKRKKDNDVFASAEDFENDMEDIIQFVQSREENTKHEFEDQTTERPVRKKSKKQESGAGVEKDAMKENGIKEAKKLKKRKA